MIIDSVKYSCCFFGHRNTPVTDTLTIKLKTYIENLIVENDISIFLFGCNSKFDELCHRIVSDLKEKFPHIKRVYVRAKFPVINADYEKYISKFYEYTYFPEQLKNSRKALYIKRNYEMINKSKFCVVYYDENNTPKDVRSTRNKSGTGMALEYAKKRGLCVKNFCD